MLQDLSRMEKLQADIDVRMMDLLQEIPAETDEETLKTLVFFCRAAYSKGYNDAWVEPRQAALFLDHGYTVPVRSAT